MYENFSVKDAYPVVKYRLRPFKWWPVFLFIFTPALIIICDRLFPNMEKNNLAMYFFAGLCIFTLYGIVSLITDLEDVSKINKAIKEWIPYQTHELYCTNYKGKCLISAFNEESIRKNVQKLEATAKDGRFDPKTEAEILNNDDSQVYNAELPFTLDEQPEVITVLLNPKNKKEYFIDTRSFFTAKGKKPDL